MKYFTLLVALALSPAVFGRVVPRHSFGMHTFDKHDAKPVPVAIPSGSCGVNKYGTRSMNTTGYIVGGTTAVSNSWPWQVSLQYGGSHTCGGSIYNNQYILTAAHCFTGTMTPSRWKVKAGKQALSKTESGEATYSVSDIIRHEDYKLLTNANDIALLKLSKPITYTDNIQPVCMPSKTAGSYNGEDATVTGWGATREGGSVSNTLQQVTVPVITNSACQKSYSNENILDSMLCAGYTQGGKDSCQGDSGGPFVHKSGDKWTQIGVVSWGYGCAQAGYPGVYTRVSSYIDWLNKNAV